MTPRAAFPALAALSLVLTGCTSVVPSAGGSRQPPPAAGYTPLHRPEPTGVMGADARGLARLFGEPRLDIRDPGVRKLQFANERCVLDTYLYPPAANREPVVTHVNARGPDGAAVNWQSCVQALRRR